jgi:hypothetical protein
MTQEELESLAKGGQGSGNFGHAGRPGERGGSGEGGEGKEGTTSPKEPLRTASQAVERWNGIMSEHEASERHARAIKSEVGYRTLEFNIKTGDIDIPEKVQNYAEKSGGDTADEVFWQHHSDKTEELISEIRSDIPESGEIGAAGRSGWLVMNVPDKGSNVESMVDGIEKIPDRISNKIKEIKADLGSDEWWKERLPKAYK